MSNSLRLHSRHPKMLLIVLWLIAFTTSAFGQYQWPYDQKTALATPDSRADREADRLVSLSPDKILSILRSETGLLLELKKVLVRKAYEQGRLLDPEDLTDEALFQLIREDDNVRVLATREIEERYYIKAKPTQDELQRNCELYGSLSAQQQAQKPPQPDTNAPHNQETAYWVKHEEDLYHPCLNQPLINPQTTNNQASQVAQPNTQAAPQRMPYYVQQPGMVPRSIPENLPPDDPRRQLLSAQMQSPMGNYFDGMQGDMSQMPRIRPDDLPQLLRASQAMNGGSSGELGGFGMSGIGVGGMGLMGMGIGSGFGLGPSLGSLGGSSNDMLPPPIASLPQQASLENPNQTLVPPTFHRYDRPLLHHRPNPYADVPSLYDLYSQYSRYTPTLERFGEDIFLNGTGNVDELPMDLPAGPDYVVGPGDGLKIDLWGGVSNRLVRVIDREGQLSLPEVGSIQVAGRTLGDVQHLVQSVLRTQFRDVEADVSLARIRTVRVYVVGDVERPGAYDISSLSTPLNAVFVAGGPTSRGSLRILRHYRGNQLVQQVDVYDLLLHGVHSNMQHLQPGDTILVPPIGQEVTVEGMVRRPAIYELNGEKSLSEVLELAGGVLPSGTLRHVDVERVIAHESRTMLRVDMPETNNQASVNKTLDDFAIQDGDKIKISPILPYADKTVYLDGHVFRPGKYAYHEGMKVTDLIKSYNDLLPEPYKRHAEIIRLNPPDYTPTVLAFNLADALAGKAQDVILKPFDTVRVFGRFDFEDPPVVSVTGEVRDPGDHVTNGATYLRDAIYLAGGTTADAELDDVQVFRKTDDGRLRVLSVNLGKALAGDRKDNLLLQPKDRIFIHKDLAKVDPPTVVIQGEVARPGKYPLGEGMSTADLVRLAGGLKRGAYTDTADLTRYLVEDGKKVVGEHKTVPIAEALAGQPDTDIRLRDGDVLTIGELAGWKDVGASITVKGEVLHPGTYGIREGERLSSIIARAGGFRTDAYAYGAVFERVQVRDIEAKNRLQLIREVQDEGTALKAAPEADPAIKQASLLQWQTTLQTISDTPPNGRLVIHISNNMKRWVGTSADIQVRAGDTIYIPKTPSIVMVDGSVYNPTAVTFKPGKSSGWYLRQAGGATAMANKKAMFVIRADGSVVGGSGGLFSGGAEDVVLQAGDMVVVPQKAYSANSRWKNTLQLAQLTSAVGIAIQVAKGF